MPLPTAHKHITGEAARVLDKVRKILALSGSPVAAEAQAAMNVAARLMASHNLRSMDTNESQVYEFNLINLGEAKLTYRSSHIAHILTRHFFVKTIFLQSYNARKNRNDFSLEIIGRPENLKLAEHVFNFLKERSESLWQDYYRSHKGGGLVARNSFITGLLMEFDHKLEEASKEPQNLDLTGGDGFSALVLVKDAGLEHFYKKRYPNAVTKKSAKRRLFDPKSNKVGRAAGKSLNIYKPLEYFSNDNKETFLLDQIGILILMPL